MKIEKMEKRFQIFCFTHSILNKGNCGLVDQNRDNNDGKFNCLLSKNKTLLKN